MVSIFKGKKRTRLLALVAAVAFLLSGALSFIQPETAYADSWGNCKSGTVGKYYVGGPWDYTENDNNPVTALEILESVSGLPDGVSAESKVDPRSQKPTLWFRGTPTKAGTFTFKVKVKATFKDNTSKENTSTYTIK